MNLFMLVGLPASGKSTFIQKAKNLTVKHGKPPFAVLSTDMYIEQAANAVGKTYNDVFFNEIKPATKLMYDDLEYAIMNGLDIIWDQTNLTAKSRMQKMSQVPTTYHRYAIVFECPEQEEWLRRLDSRTGKTIPDGVLQNMANSYEGPSFDEGYEKIFIIKKNGQEMDTLSCVNVRTTPELMWCFMQMGG